MWGGGGGVGLYLFAEMGHHSPFSNNQKIVSILH